MTKHKYRKIGKRLFRPIPGAPALYGEVGTDLSNPNNRYSDLQIDGIKERKNSTCKLPNKCSVIKRSNSNKCILGIKKILSTFKILPNRHISPSKSGRADMRLSLSGLSPKCLDRLLVKISKNDSLMCGLSYDIDGSTITFKKDVISNKDFQFLIRSISSSYKSFNDNKFLGFVLIECLLCLVSLISLFTGRSFVYYFIVFNVIFWFLVGFKNGGLK